MTKTKRIYAFIRTKCSPNDLPDTVVMETQKKESEED